jgi:hypothetical protein
MLSQAHFNASVTMQVERIDQAGIVLRQMDAREIMSDEKDVNASSKEFKKNLCKTFDRQKQGMEGCTEEFKTLR